MMTEQKEIELSQQVRLLSRQYCDGEFNKGEYRRRRREILDQCIDHDLNGLEPEFEVDEVVESVPQSTPLNWMPYLMALVTVGVVAIMGYLVHSLV